MSQLNIAMKKNSMRKNKKLVVNIAPKNEALASRSVEADHDLGSSRDEDQSKIESSERRRDVFHKVEVGTGLSGALKRLREQGTFKEKKGKLVVGGVTDNYGDDRFRDAFKDIRIERVDEHGRMLTEKKRFGYCVTDSMGRNLGRGRKRNGIGNTKISRSRWNLQKELWKNETTSCRFKDSLRCSLIFSDS
ncbi:unnamed protein product [Microthlaspi erraticum]|uniref:Uncharacterized protein n=1 Tax=Microthlaspi erraticum TaxID=1685480 RepID=A0A6D2IIU8_9BRAS|nr:unnamed protein product [Microthlaspi erraticum]